MNIIDQIEAEQLRELPAFRPGDTLRVHARIVEGDKERIQVFEGVCIRRSRGGSGASRFGPCQRVRRRRRRMMCRGERGR